MDSLTTLWKRLDARRRAVVVGATLLMFLAIALLARGPGTRPMALLYAGLDGAAAGEVVAALEARGTPYEVRGDAIWVPEGVRDLERMTLAGEGLPAASSGGYERLDSLSGFGTTAQMFDAAYWRAKEGEFARTILALPAVRAVRVHVAAGSGRPFRRSDPPSAAVTVTMRSGALPPEQAQALRHLVAAAVPGLSPDAVAVIDAEAGLVEDAEVDAPDHCGEALAARAERLLEARVGPGNAVVEVSVETVTETERLTERRLDPEGRVAVSAESEESESTARRAGGTVTVASNLPDGEAAGGEGEGSSEESSRTLTNYELSETSREVLREPGAVRRLTVAVLVNDVAATDEAGVTTFSPRPEEEMAALAALVASAVGLDEARGDQITVRSLPFEPLAALGSEAAPPLGAPADLIGLARPALLALVAIVLALFVLRPLLARGGPPPALLPAPGPLALPDLGGAALPARGIGSSAMGEAGAPGPAVAEALDPAARLRRLIESRQDETAQILQSWIEDTPRETA